MSSGVAWSDLAASHLISTEEERILTAYDGQNAESHADLWDEYGEDHARTFMAVLGKVSQPAVLKHTLFLVNNAFEADDSRARYFFLASSDPYAPFIAVIEKADVSVATMASMTIGGLMKAAFSVFLKGMWVPDAKACLPLLKWACNGLAQQKAALRDASIRFVGVLLRVEANRMPFYSLGGLTLIVNAVEAARGDVQFVYDAGFAVWLATLDEEVGVKAAHVPGLLRLVAALLKTATKEKVVRVAAAAALNMVADAWAAEHMLDEGVLKAAIAQRRRKYEDEDVPADLGALVAALEGHVRVLSTYEQYHKEVLSGHLVWSPLHRSEQFWLDHGAAIEEDNCDVLRVLVNLLETSGDETTLAIACHDLGEFARLHPRGRQILRELGAKTRVMLLIDNDAMEVAREALQCVQKLFLTNWESVDSK
eukprot:TRINITY_DN4337_c0_g1_i2.p2 TRINITY_DN4337_c0_g1~~TRINITY_DN4337_c0_g1_i2.p2  ORF type:complete len:424 (+),score=95.36 TRINITY_DN4337_c0_g1_i2:345-1616(+)